MAKRILFIGLVISILALGISAQAQPLIIKFGHSGTKVHQYHIGATMLAEQVEKNSGGKMKIEVFPDAQLGGERDLAEGTRLGTVDMAVAAAAAYSRCGSRSSRSWKCLSCSVTGRTLTRYSTVSLETSSRAWPRKKA